MERTPKAEAVCPMCGGTGRILVRLPGGEEVEAACLECLEREEDLVCEFCGDVILPEEVEYTPYGEVICEPCLVESYGGRKELFWKEVGVSGKEAP